MSFSGFLDKTGNIEHETPGAADGGGGYAASSWAVIHRRVKFSLVLIKKEEAIIEYAKDKVFAEYFIYLEPLSGIQEGDRMVWNGRYFYFKLIMNWQEKGRFGKIACVELGRNE